MCDINTLYSSIHIILHLFYAETLMFICLTSCYIHKNPRCNIHEILYNSAWSSNLNTIHIAKYMTAFICILIHCNNDYLFI